MRLTGRRFTGPNVWPDDAMMPGFRGHILEYLQAMEDFTNRLLPAVSVSLDLDPAFFTPHFVESQFNLRLSHYPPVAADANQFGIAPHSDANFMTFLVPTIAESRVMIRQGNEQTDSPGDSDRADDRGAAGAGGDCRFPQE